MAETGHGPVRRGSGRNPAYAAIGKYLSLAFLLPASVFVGYVIGVLLDRAFGTSFLTVVFLLFGVAAGLIELVRELQKEGRKGGNGGA